MTRKTLKKVRYLGKFYEYEGGLGWMPLHRAIFCSIVTPHQIHWVKQSDVKFN
jgi:prenyltransferase beta subunit